MYTLSLFICCITGFFIWSIFQKGYVANGMERTMVFSVAVPLIASFLSFIYLCIDKGSLDESFVFLSNGLSKKSDVFFIIGASLGLACAYITYPILLEKYKLFAVYYAPINLLMISSFFIIFKWEDVMIKFDRNPYWNESLGVSIIVLGIFILNWQLFFKKIN